MYNALQTPHVTEKMNTSFNLDPRAIPLQGGTFHLAVFGCQMNVYDGSRIRDLMRGSGFEETADPARAGVVILLTCAVRARAENRVFKLLETWLSRGAVRQDAVIALGGCVGSELGEKIVARCGRIGVVFGPGTVHRLPELVRGHLATGEPQIAVAGPPLDKFSALPPPGESALSAFVTIMEGCSNRCSYCIVPYTRGPEVSRPPEDVLEECSRLLAAGAREIHLLGQNVNSYRGTARDGTDCGFAALLYQVAALPGVGRIRFTTSNPMDFTDDIVRAVGELDSVADGIHIPLQSGSDRILSLMRRRYTLQDYRALIARLRRVRPTLAVSSDFIVGFPGETRGDFESTVRSVEDIGFDQCFSFVYSPRPGTPAAGYPDDVAPAAKRERLYELQEAIERSARRSGEGMIGSRQTILVEGVSRKNALELRGRASSGRVTVFEGGPELIGQFVGVRVTGVSAHTLRARRL